MNCSNVEGIIPKVKLRQSIPFNSSVLMPWENYWFFTLNGFCCCYRVLNLCYSKPVLMTIELISCSTF